MQMALMTIKRTEKGKKVTVPAGECFKPSDGDELNELQGMDACRDATEDEIAIHERRNKSAPKKAADKKTPAKKAAAKADEGDGDGDGDGEDEAKGKGKDLLK